MLARRYEAPTVEQALDRVRQELGPDAVVLYARERKPPRWWRWVDPGGVEVIAMPRSAPPPAPPRWRAAPPIRRTRGRCRRVAFVGPTGAGKTTTIAKLACEFRRRGWDVQVIAGDTWRAGAARQLAEYGRALGIPVHPLAALDRDLRAEVLLVDLPGVHPTMGERWEDVQKILSRMAPQEVHLVLSAATSATVLRRIQEDLLPLGATRCVLTHLDEVDSSTLHEALAAVDLPLSYLTYSPEVPGAVASAGSRAARQWLPQS